VDDERRLHERRARAEGDPEALLRDALAWRRVGDLESARERLDAVLAVAPGHELARALLVLTEAALGRPVHGSFYEASRHGVSLARFLDPRALATIARSALDPANGPVDAMAVDELVASGKAGVLAVLEAFTEDAVARHPDRVRLGLGLRARSIARAGVAAREVSVDLRRRIAEALQRPRRGSRRNQPQPAGAEWVLLAGAIHWSGVRLEIERILGSDEDPRRQAAAVALELLGDRESRPALERALAAARTRGERVVIARALEQLAL
jgi:hypothetical protein